MVVLIQAIFIALNLFSTNSRCVSLFIHSMYSYTWDCFHSSGMNLKWWRNWTTSTVWDASCRSRRCRTWETSSACLSWLIAGPLRAEIEKHPYPPICLYLFSFFCFLFTCIVFLTSSSTFLFLLLPSFLILSLSLHLYCLLRFFFFFTDIPC